METFWIFALLMFVLAACFGTLFYGAYEFDRRKEECRTAVCPEAYVVQFDNGLCFCVMGQL